MQRGGTEGQYTQHIRSKRSTVLFHAETAGHHCSAALRTKFITSRSLNESADTNPSFLDHKMIKCNLKHHKRVHKMNCIHYEQFSMECFPQIYVLYTYFAGLRTVDFKTCHQYVFACVYLSV